MTTNAGAAELAEQAIGFGSGHPHRATTRKRSPACSRRNSATGSDAIDPVRAAVGGITDQVVVGEVHPAAGRAVLADRNADDRGVRWRPRGLGYPRRVTTRCSASARLPRQGRGSSRSTSRSRSPRSCCSGTLRKAALCGLSVRRDRGQARLLVPRAASADSALDRTAGARAGGVARRRRLPLIEGDWEVRGNDAMLKDASAAVW